MIRFAIALAVLGLIGATPAAAASPPWDGVSFHPYSVDPGNADCVPWSDPVIGTTHECDPIDLIFPGQSLPQVVDRLHAAGWTDTGGTSQWLYVDGVLVPAGAQLGRADGPDPTQRYHVRIWQAATDVVVGNVHHEHGSPHRIDMAWDEAEAFAATGLCASWCGHVHLTAADAIQGPDGSWRGWPNDGDATVVPLAPPAAASAAATGPVKAKAGAARKHKRPHRTRHG